MDVTVKLSSGTETTRVSGWGSFVELMDNTRAAKGKVGIPTGRREKVKYYSLSTCKDEDKRQKVKDRMFSDG